MNLELNKINVLPVKTWSWLAVNHLSLNEVIPDILPFHKDVIRKNGIDVDAITVKGNDKEFDDLYELSTGVGNEAVEFIRNNKNVEVSLRIPQGKKVAEPVFLEYNLDDENQSIVDVNRIIAEEDSEVTVVLNYQSKDKLEGFHAGLTFLHAKKNATINLVVVQLLNDECIHINDIGTSVEDNGTIRITQAELGGKKVVHGLKTDLVGKDSTQIVNSIYFGDKKRFIDINYIVHHMGKFSISEMKLNGALLDEGRKLFRGTIDFQRGSVGARGEEEEFNLLFSPKIKNITAPLILCGEENVEGKHGANSGKILGDQLFYMMSRGIDELTAKKILIECSFLPVIEEVPDENLQNKILEYIKGRLSYVQHI